MASLFFGFRWRKVFGLALAALLFASTAEAADSTSELRLQMDQGQALYLSGKYDEAAAVFENGYQAYPYSAFLFNAGVCYQKLGQKEKALASFRRYLEKDPKAPDAASVAERIKGLEAALIPPSPQATPGEEVPPTPVPAATNLPDAEMKALVIVESEPKGAPIRIFRRKPGVVAVYQEGSPLYELLVRERAPARLSLDVGHYHIVIDAFEKFNKSETDIVVESGHVYVFQANLSQGQFLAFLRVSANAPDANVYLDDDGKRHVVWGKAPHAEMVAKGHHTVLVTAPGFADFTQEIELTPGEQKELVVELSRVKTGILRVDANAKEVFVAIDGRPVGSYRKGDEALSLPLAAGTHELLVTGDGLKDLRVQVEVPPGQVLPMRARMMKKYPRGAAWAQAIVAVGLIGASTYFAVESNRLDSELKTAQSGGHLSPTDPRIQQGFWYSVGADAGFAVGGIFGALSIYNFVRDPYPESQLQRGAARDFDAKEAAIPGGESAKIVPMFGGAL